MRSYDTILGDRTQFEAMTGWTVSDGLLAVYHSRLVNVRSKHSSRFHQSTTNHHSNLTYQTLRENDY